MEEDLNKLIELWSSSTTSVERQQIIDHIIKKRKYKYTVKSLLDNKNLLFEQCREIHQEIVNLQEVSKEKQNQVRTINNFLSQLYNVDHAKLNEPKEINDVPNDHQNKQQSDNPIDEPAQSGEIKNNAQPTREVNEIQNNDEKSIKDQMIKAEITRRMNRKAKMIKSFKKGLQPRSEVEILKERERIVKEIQKYSHLDFEKLEVEKVLCDSAEYFDTIKLMNHQIIRVRFKPNQKSSYNQQITILKYLEKCDLTPRVLHFNSTKQTIYLPYYGDPPHSTQENSRTLSIILGKLKRNWGVFQLKNGQVLNSIKSHGAMYSSKLKRFFIYDFTSPDWVVDRDRPYPMIN